jgi:hypothetical protein
MQQHEVNETLAEYEFRRHASEDALYDAVGRMRAQGATWLQIGNALGVTPQAAWQRFAGKI